MKVIPKRTFLLKQEEAKNGKMKDVIAEAGKEIEVSDKEYKQFAGSWDADATAEINKKSDKK